MGYHRRRVHQCSILHIVPQALSSSTNKVHVQEVSSRGVEGELIINNSQDSRGIRAKPRTRKGNPGVSKRGGRSSWTDQG
jgi:hypothetical protein